MLNRWIIGLCTATLLLAMAGSASAQSSRDKFRLVGFWYQNRGPLVDIPINGAPAGCALFGSNMLLGPPARSNAGFPDGAFTPAGNIPAPASIAGQPNAACLGILNEPTSGTLSILNPNVGAVPTGGGIPHKPGVTVVMNPGSAPRSFTVPPNAFGQNAGKQVVAVAVAPDVIQLASTFSLNGPGNQTLVPLDRNFRKSAWLAQPGRMGKSFTWCPPGTTAGQVGSCTHPANAGNVAFPAINGLIRYRAGTNAFGGTMQMALTGNADVTIILGAPTGGGQVPIAHQPVAGMGFQEQGGNYAFFGVATFGPAPGHSTYVINTPCTNPLPAQPAGCSQIVSSGPTTTPSALGPGVNYNWGMPWTTGTVTVLNTETIFLQPRTTTLTAMGSDSRDALGAGNITLVAGGTSYRIQAVQNFAAIDVVHLKLLPFSQLPGLSSYGVGLAGVLIALSAGYLLRRRF